jgi:hypothetical protein
MRERGDGGIVTENGYDERLRWTATMKTKQTKQQGSRLAAFIVSSIFFAHKLAQSLYLFIVYYWFIFILFFVVIFVVKQHWEHVLYCLALCVTHYVDAGIYHLCEELMFQYVSPAIASNDALYMPKLQVIQKCVMSNAYLANEQLIDVAGGF